MRINGVPYSHIVDPHSGIGITDHSLVTVLGPEAGKKLIESMDKVACYLKRQPGDKIEQPEPKRWKELERDQK